MIKKEIEWFSNIGNFSKSLLLIKQSSILFLRKSSLIIWLALVNGNQKKYFDFHLFILKTNQHSPFHMIKVKLMLIKNRYKKKRGIVKKIKE